MTRYAAYKRRERVTVKESTELKKSNSFDKSNKDQPRCFAVFHQLKEKQENLWFTKDGSLQAGVIQFWALRFTDFSMGIKDKQIFRDLFCPCWKLPKKNKTKKQKQNRQKKKNQQQ